MLNKRIIITGGSGFIGSHVMTELIKQGYQVINIDKLTYASVPSCMLKFEENSNYKFHQLDITDTKNIEIIFRKYKPAAIMHLAAESHVDNSIEDPKNFIQTNIIGTHSLLDVSLKYFNETSDPNFRFLHISTDEVYGTLGEKGSFTENTRYDPRSPYSASKAASDHLVKAYWHTYKLPILVSNCSNNYGPHQHFEKFVPKLIINALKGEDIPIYGSGKNIRDWLYVTDHVSALMSILHLGRPGETYNIGGNNELSNLEIAGMVLRMLSHEIRPKVPYETLLKHVPDRLGHDYRYAIDATKLRNELQWMPQTKISNGLKNTINWYVQNINILKNIDQK